jgi:hypothetical protein
MHNIVGLAIFAVGIVLLISGFSDSGAVGSEISRLLAGYSVDSSLWMLLGGAGSVVLGLLLALRSRAV